MWTPASEDMDSLLSACDFSLRDSWEDDEEQEGFSGMKSATRKATTTVQAPKRKGGPGMRVCCERRGEKMFGHTVLSFIRTQKVQSSRSSVSLLCAAVQLEHITTHSGLEADSTVCLQGTTIFYVVHMYKKWDPMFNDPSFFALCNHEVEPNKTCCAGHMSITM